MAPPLQGPPAERLLFEEQVLVPAEDWMAQSNSEVSR